MEKCDVCGHSDAAPYYKNDKRILQCQKCGIVFLSHDLRIKNQDEYYGDGDLLESRYEYIKDFQQTNEQNAKDRVKVMLKYIKPEGRSLLDIGANTGFFVKEAIKAGFKAEGIEPNKFAVEYAQKNNIPVKNATIENFIPEHKFDIVTIFGVLEHLEKPVDVFGKIKNFLIDNGILIIEVPNIKSYAAKKRGAHWKSVVLEHIFYFSGKTLSKIIRDNGFEIIDLRQSDYYRGIGIRECLRRIFGINFEKEPLIDRFQPKKACFEAVPTISKRGRFKKFVRRILLLLVKILKREDFLIVIAKKQNEIL